MQSCIVQEYATSDTSEAAPDPSKDIEERGYRGRIVSPGEDVSALAPCQKTPVLLTAGYALNGLGFVSEAVLQP
jgi:hypothetical protein